MPAYGYVLLGVSWLLWLAPFFLFRPTSRAPVTRDRRALWGIVVQAVSYSILWQNSFWARPLALWRVTAAVPLFAVAALLSWSAVRALGPHWRVEAGLDADHSLVQDGPYRLVRHPIYASMLCMMIGSGLMVSPLPLLAGALMLFVAGTEIRVRVEDRLLAARFGEAFTAYRRAVPAYVPLVR